MRPFPVIIGATAGGKSDLAVELALLLARRGAGAGEVISADAFQVYRGLDIGAAKPTLAERQGVPHHLIDIRDPDEPFSVDQWLSLAEPLIDQIRARGGVPIVVGGTHLYVKALLEGLFEGPPPDPALRQELMRLDSALRRAELERLDPAAAARIHPNDVRRTVRALEVLRQTGQPISQWQSQWDAGSRRDDALLVVLQRPTEEVNRRINARVKAMVEAGLIDEARALWASGSLGRQAREGLGYKQLIDAFEGRTSLEDAIERIKIETRRLAKNQRTWMRRLAVGRSTQRDTSSQQPTVSGESTGRTLMLDASGRAASVLAQIVADSILASKGHSPP